MPRNINTPVGEFAVPNHIAERIEKLSDIQLLEEYITKCKNFIDPFLFNEMEHRKLIFAGEHNADVEKRLAAMKAAFTPSRNDLIEKIDAEFGYSITTSAARNALYNTPMTDEMVQALYAIDNVIDKICEEFEAATEEVGEDADLYDVVGNYLEQVEHDYLAARVFDRVKQEYGDYLDEVKKLPPEKIVEAAYKITTLHDIHINLNPDTSRHNTEQLKALRSLDSPLWSLYHEWQRRDFTHMDDIKAVITDVANKHATDIENNEYNLAEYSLEPYEIYKILKTEEADSEHDNEADDGYEP